VRYGFVIDQDRCIGCHACTVACKEEHQVPVGVFRTWVKYIEKGEFPHTRRHFGVMRCNHCDSAPCITICPTQALYRRSDGIVDFDNRRCIGCKSCMQACPYDALYIDPNTNTAAKCNFCAHRVEQSLEPACVIVCPTQAIIAGDLDNPASQTSRIVATEKVSVRKPHKGTEPKLYYKGIEGDLLEPTRLSRQNTYLFADQHDKRVTDPSFDPAVTREVYDVGHPAPWGWKIAAYLWTKSIAAGVMLVAAIVMGFSTFARVPVLTIGAPLVSLVALGLTSLLLIIDLKRPDRFFYLLTKPNFRSWLVIGAWILMAFGAAVVAWLICGVNAIPIPDTLLIVTAILAIASACYSAFLFAQARGRDLWQSPLFFWHLLFHCFLAGGATLIIVAGFAHDLRMAANGFIAMVVFLPWTLLLTFTELMIPHATEDARLAVKRLIRGDLSAQLWFMCIMVGMVVPILFIAGMIWTRFSPGLALLCAFLVLTGLWYFEALWVKAGQSVPLS
jgi:Fe-S-cluster-containing dehydrogenase component/formate-dependent nitrite reductase membrane component NrfD